MKKVYAKGVFDLVHYGHVRFLRDARLLGDWLTVGVTPDERAAALKRKPLTDASRRAEVIAAIRWVDEVITDGPQAITVDFMKKNGFCLYAFGSANEKERAFRLNDCAELPREMIVEIPYTHEISTTALIDQAGRR